MEWETDAEVAEALDTIIAACEAHAAASSPDVAQLPSARGGAVAAASGSGVGDDSMPDASDAGAMLLWLRARIPPSLLKQYRQPHVVSDKEHAVALQRLEVYEREIQRVMRSGQVKTKFDLSAACQLPSIYPAWGLWEKTYGHKPGVRLGQRFKGRGWLQALGLHTLYYAGIMQEKENPAYAICLSGGYEDDDDHGDWLWYTGQGGRDDGNGKQGKDQEWTKGNAAIRACMEQGTPLRVCRGVPVMVEEWNAEKTRKKLVKKLEYTYDGLYCVVRADRVVGKGGKSLVCKFLLVGIPGHYKANKSVSFMELRGFKDRRLARADSDDEEEGPEAEDDEELGQGYMAGRQKRQKTQRAAAAQRAAASAATAAPKVRKKKARGATVEVALHAALIPVVQDAAWLAALRQRPGLVCDDISGGVEKFRVPLFNEVDDEPPPQLTYTRSSVFGSAEAQQFVEEGRRVMPGSWCGVAVGDPKGSYLADGRMASTRCDGHWECFPDCQQTRKCRHNRFISEHGICLPLEVFRTRGKGWGVRCARDIPVGAFICSYEGVIVTHHDAEQLRGTNGDAYFFDLDHFVTLYEDPSIRAPQRQRLPPLPFDASPTSPTVDDNEPLVIDAAKTGNLARFINHSCEPNLVVQPVLRPGDSGIRYCIGIFAGCDIPRGTELCYSYNYKIGTVAGKEMLCHCGARKCQGRLL